MAFKVLREIRNALPRFSSRRIAISVNPTVAEQLLRDSGEALQQLGNDLGREIEIRARPGLHREQFEVVALDEGPPVAIPLRWLDGSKDRADATPPDAPDMLDAPDTLDTPPETPETPDTPPETPDTADTADTADTESDLAAAPASLQPPQGDPATPAPSAPEVPPEPASLAAQDPAAAAHDTLQTEAESPSDPQDEVLATPLADESEVLDGEPESRILPGSRQPEES